jgi:hypothetical protein
MYARDACIGLAGAGLALSLAPLVFGGPDALLIGEAVGGMLLGNFGYYVCSADPPLRSYRVIAEPRKHTIHIKFKGFNAVQDRVLNAAAQNTDNANSLSQAMTLCLDRASGAAQAGATVWVRRQRACAAKYANTLAQTTRAQLQWQSAVSQLLRNAGLKDASLTPAILLKTLQSPSAEQTQQLKREGFNAGQMKLIQAAVTNPTVAAAMPNRIYASIDGPTVRSALIKAAKAYDAIYELNR